MASISGDHKQYDHCVARIVHDKAMPEITPGNVLRDMWFGVLVIISEQCTAPSKTKWQPGHVRVPQQKKSFLLTLLLLPICCRLLTQAKRKSYIFVLARSSECGSMPFVHTVISLSLLYLCRDLCHCHVEREIGLYSLDDLSQCSLSASNSYLVKQKSLLAAWYHIWFSQWIRANYRIRAVWACPKVCYAFW